MTDASYAVGNFVTSGIDSDAKASAEDAGVSDRLASALSLSAFVLGLDMVCPIFDIQSPKLLLANSLEADDG